MMKLRRRWPICSAAPRKQRLAINLVGAEVFMERLNHRLLAGEAAHEAAWRLLLELLQRHGTQERFEERAVDYAITFELSPPSWGSLPKPGGKTASVSRSSDDGAHYLAAN